MPRQIPGDPLTGSVPALPRTQLVVPQRVYGPTRSRQPGLSREAWPIVPDSLAVTMAQLQPGRVASVRTRWGVRQMLVRVVRVSAQRRNRGRHYVVGMNQHGRCWSAWVDRVTSVHTVEQALALRRVIDAQVKGE